LAIYFQFLEIFIKFSSKSKSTSNFRNFLNTDLLQFKMFFHLFSVIEPFECRVFGTQMLVHLSLNDLNVGFVLATEYQSSVKHIYTLYSLFIDISLSLHQLFALLLRRERGEGTDNLVKLLFLLRFLWFMVYWLSIHHLYNSTSGFLVIRPVYILLPLLFINQDTSGLTFEFCMRVVSSPRNFASLKR